MRGGPITQILTVVGLLVIAFWSIVAAAVVVAALLGLLIWLVTVLVRAGASGGEGAAPETPQLPEAPHPLASENKRTRRGALMNRSLQQDDVRSSITEQFWANAQTPRSTIFGAAERLLAGPRTDARDMWPGYVGPNYRAGGLVLVAHYPAGGTAAYPGSVRAERDDEFYKLIAAFKSAGPETRLAAFERLNEHVEELISYWRMFKVISLVLDAADVTLRDVALINLVPYRIADNRSPSKAVMEAAWASCTGASLRVLAPGSVAALGAVPGAFLLSKGVAPLHVFKRTNGDSYIHPEAVEAARRLAQGAGRKAAQPRAATVVVAQPRRSGGVHRAQPAGLALDGRFTLGPASPPSTTSVHGIIRTVVGRSPGLSGQELMARLRAMEWSWVDSPHTRPGPPKDSWLLGYVKGGLRRGFLERT